MEDFARLRKELEEWKTLHQQAFKICEILRQKVEYWEKKHALAFEVIEAAEKLIMAGDNSNWDLHSEIDTDVVPLEATIKAYRESK